MSVLVRATPHVSRCTAASSGRPAAATSAWTASKDRAAAPQLPPAGNPITIMSPTPIAPESRTEISMGTRAHADQPSTTSARRT
jgi:hypothetical protein